MKRYVFFIIFLLFVSSSHSQDLYIKFEEALERQHSYTRRVYNSIEKVERDEKVFYFHYKVYDGHFIEFITKNKNQSQTVLLGQLNSLNLKSIQDIESQLVSRTNREQVAFFSEFETIYIVETNISTGKATIYEVKIDIW